MTTKTEDAAVSTFHDVGVLASSSRITIGIDHSAAGVPVKRGRVHRRAALAHVERALALRSPAMLRVFGALCACDLAASFQGVRLLGELPKTDGPLVLVANHPSWWDIELFAFLGTTVFADRRAFVPMDALNLSRYGFLKRLGTFPVNYGSFAGASSFLAVAEEVLRPRSGLLFLNVEGCFRDVRARPIQPMPGLAHLARRVPSATFVPLAIDYVFWRNRRPNLLIAFGAPPSAGQLAAMPTAVATAHLAGALEATMSALAEAGMSRDPSRFRNLLNGRYGIGFLVDLWRRGVLGGRRLSAPRRDES